MSPIVQPVVDPKTKPVVADPKPAPDPVATASADAEKQRNAAKFIERIIGKKPDPKPAETPEPKPDAKPKPDPAPAAPAPAAPAAKADKPDEPKEAEKQRPAAKKAKPQMEEGDVSRIAAAAATAAVDQISRNRPEPKPDTKSDPKPEFSRADSIRLKKLEVIASEFPEHKHIVEDANAFYRKGGLRDQYQKKWEEANPEGKFDPKDDAHDAWFERNDPMLRVGDDELEVASDVLTDRRAKEISDDRVNGALSKREKEERLRNASTVASSAVNDVAVEALKGMGFSEELKDPAKLKAIEDDQPVAAYILGNEVQAVTPIINGVVELFSGKDFEPSNPSHDAVARLFSGLEAKILQIPEEDRVKNGRQFVTADQWNSLTASQKRGKWTLGQDELLAYIKSDVTQRAKAQYEKFNGKKPKVTPAPEKAAPTEQPKTLPKTESPSVSATSLSPVPGKEHNEDGMTQQKLWVKRMMS